MKIFVGCSCSELQCEFYFDMYHSSVTPTTLSKLQNVHIVLF